MSKVTPVKNIRYFIPPDGFVISGRDGNVAIPCDGIPLPLSEEDFESLQGGVPTYDLIGNGLHQLLRAEPDAMFAASYAKILRDGYPHLLSELATQILMLDHKDVDVPYIDRKINFLKIFALLEPENPQLKLEIGESYLDRGLHLSALQESTSSMYSAEKYIAQARELAPGDAFVAYRYGEISYILGRYAAAVDFWRESVEGTPEDKRGELERRLLSLEEGSMPRVPVVDYLEATAVAFDLYREGDFEEAVAIINDIIDDDVFWKNFRMPEAFFVLGKCYEKLDMPRYAEDSYREALQILPGFSDAEEALNQLLGKG